DLTARRVGNHYRRSSARARTAIASAHTPRALPLDLGDAVTAARDAQRDVPCAESDDDADHGVREAEDGLSPGIVRIQRGGDHHDSGRDGPGYDIVAVSGENQQERPGADHRRHAPWMKRKEQQVAETEDEAQARRPDP